MFGGPSDECTYKKQPMKYGNYDLSMPPGMNSSNQSPL